MEVIAIDIPELGNRSYLVHDGKSAIVIDPSRRTTQIADRATDAHVTIGAVFETHIHNDYVTGGLALAEQLGVPYYVSAHDSVNFRREPVEPDQTVRIGKLQITALAAPGHTHHHLGYLVTDDITPTPAFFSGGSLLYGAVGRTDLVSETDTKPLAAAQYQTAQFLRDRLEPATLLYPTHGFGSFCAATQTDEVSVSTLRQQIATNTVFNAKDEASFVASLIEGFDDYPAYYTYMAAANLQGPAALKLAPPARLSRAAVLRALHNGAAVIDMRTRIAYASKHMPGTYNVELSNDLATYIGWLIEWDTPLILVAGSKEAVATAQEQLALIGREVTGGQVTPQALLQQTATYPVHTFADLAAALPDDRITILDVRRNSEHQKRQIPDALHIPLHELRGKLRDIDTNQNVWVHCSTGFRASIAASVLSGNNIRVVLINDDFKNATTAGLIPIENKPFIEEVSTGEAQLVDVRDISEWQAGHATGAIHMPLGQILEGDLSLLNPDKSIYLYCDTGDRSGMAENCLCSMGYNAANIGGITDWVQAGGSTVTK
jgi:rhodanese-related sulfurtransferase/glyoxylase-like metal-dependent hydrolase (beta-lactamase superfamily II)